MTELVLKPWSQKTTIPFYPGLEALPILCEETYRALGSHCRLITDVISPSVYNYYIAVLAYSRLIYLHKYNNGIISNAERALLDNFLPCKVPAVIAKYLKGFGNVELEYSDLMFYLLPRPTLALPFSFDKQPSEAWFGKMNESSHYLYAMYPSLFIHFQNILEDLQLTFFGTDPNWNIPYFMSPNDINKGKPTLNLLGYKPAVKLGENHVHFLRNLGISLPHYLTYPQNVVALWSSHVKKHLIFTVSNVLSGHVSGSNLSRVPLQTYGQKSQLCFQQPLTLNRLPQRRYLDYAFNNISPHQLDASVAFQGGSFLYRLKRNVDYRAGSVNSWSIFDFNNYCDVPLSWKRTANTAREMEKDMLNRHRFQSYPYLVQERVRTFISQNQF